MADQIPGSLLALSINGTALRCQTEATLELTINTAEGTPCKPSETETYKGGQWVTRTIESKDWQITMTAKAFADLIAMNQIQVSDLMINGDPVVQAVFGTTQTTDYDFPVTFAYSGEGILTGLTLNGPVDAESTYDVTILANGPLTGPTVVSI